MAVERGSSSVPSYTRSTSGGAQRHRGGIGRVALAQLDLLEYSENTLSAAKHNNGFIAGWYKGNEWKAWIIHRLGDGKWYWQTDIKTFTPRS